MFQHGCRADTPVGRTFVVKQVIRFPERYDSPCRRKRPGRHSQGPARSSRDPPWIRSGLRVRYRLRQGHPRAPRGDAARTLPRQRHDKPTRSRPTQRTALNVCLDSWAVLAWLDGLEPAAARVEHVIHERPVMSWINLAEVYHRVHRDQAMTKPRRSWPACADLSASTRQHPPASSRPSGSKRRTRSPWPTVSPPPPRHTTSRS